MKRKPLVVIYLIDGARPDVLRELIDAGELPNIAREIAGPGTFTTAISCFPSTTGPAYLPVLTGRFPGTANIPGIRWVDKAEFKRNRWSPKSIRSYNGYEALRFSSDLPLDCPTLFELFDRPFNVYSMLTRGLPKGHDRSKHVKVFLFAYGHLTNRWRPVDEACHRYVMDSLERAPDLIFASFMAVDTYSHLRHFRHPSTIDAYRYVDFSVGEAVRTLKRQGRWDDTLFLVTADHGHTPTDIHLDLATYFEEAGMRTLSYPIIWKRDPELAVMISGNSCGQIYFLDGHAGISVHGEEARALLGHHWDALLARKEVDWIVTRTEGADYRVYSERGAARITKTPQGLGYEPETADPLGLGRIAGSLGSRDSLARTFEAEYPDALVQVDQLFASPRTGDVVVVSPEGYDLRDAFEWPEHRSSHGSLHKGHMRVPLVHNQTGWRQGPSRTVDIFPSILAWAGKPIPEGVDGHSLV